MNGAGKTTLIKCLLDFCDIDGGEIRIFGIPHRETRARKPLAYLPESFLPPHSLTGRDFIKYMLALREQPYDEAAARAMCAALDLDAQALDRQARAYSKKKGGQVLLFAIFHLPSANDAAHTKKKGGQVLLFVIFRPPKMGATRENIYA